MVFGVLMFNLVEKMILCFATILLVFLTIFLLVPIIKYLKFIAFHFFPVLAKCLADCIFFHDLEQRLSLQRLQYVFPICYIFVSFFEILGVFQVFFLLYFQ